MEGTEDRPTGRPNRTGRRQFLGTMAGGSLAPWLLGLNGAVADEGSLNQAIAGAGSLNQAIAGARGLIPDENARPGAADWQLTRVRPDRKGFRTPWIEGYCSKQSVAAGETIEIMVSTRPARPFRIEFFRMGYYGGRGARLLRELGPIEGKAQA